MIMGNIQDELLALMSARGTIMISIEKMNSGFSAGEVADWEIWDPPRYWPQAGRMVLADRHLPNGRRQHIVEGVVQDGLEVANADVFGEEAIVTFTKADQQRNNK